MRVVGKDVRVDGMGIVGVGVAVARGSSIESKA
jgi:hypothetical protein